MTQETATQTKVAPSSSVGNGDASHLAAAQTAASEATRAGLLARLGHAAPTALVLGLLAMLAFWGHSTGWRLPKFSELTGAAEGIPDDWCSAHDVPETMCVECDPKLLPNVKDHGFCKRHGVHNCTLDHPDVAQLPDSHKRVRPDLNQVARALALKPRPQNNPRCPLYRRRVQFASIEAMEKAGVGVELVDLHPMVELISANGEITYDRTRITHLSSPVSGRLRQIDVAEGDAVHKGDVLVLVDAAEVGQVKASFLQALAQMDQRSKLLENVEDLIRQGVYRAGASQDVEAKAAVREAEVDLVKAEQSLLNLGLPVETADLMGLETGELAERIRFLGLPQRMIEALNLETATANLLPVLAAHDGVVISREMVPGEVVDSKDTILTFADVSHMWLTLSVRQEDAKYLSLRQTVRFVPDGESQRVPGRIAWISTAADEKSRTVKVRADLPNPQSRLRASTFGTGQIILREEENAVAVENEAVHWDGSCNVVFVRDKDFFKKDSPKVFHTRTVRPGAKNKRYTEIIAGILPGEVVATEGSGILMAAVLKNNLGAG